MARDAHMKSEFNEECFNLFPVTRTDIIADLSINLVQLSMVLGPKT